MACCCGRRTCYIVLLVIGIIILVLPLALHNYINQVVREKIDTNMRIERGSQIYDQWKKPSLPVYLKIHTFNLVNTMEIKQGKAPAVIEKGPYSYRETKEKVNITWGENKVTYNQISRYVFDPDASCGTCDPYNDTITTFNIPLIAISQKLLPLQKYPDAEKLIDAFLKGVGEQLFITKSVNHTIWGYEDPLFELYNKLRNILIEIPIIRDFAKKLPKISPNFALQPNPSFDGITTVKTGNDDIDDVGQYLEWKGMKKLPYWKSETANMLNGTDGTVYKPHLNEDDQLYIFVMQLCRSLSVIYTSDSTIQGIDALRFHPPKSTFVSGDISAANRGFCNPNCLPSGLLSVNACVPFNAPIVASSPHFLNGDPILLKKVIGLAPDEEKHDTFVHIEPHTGVILQASKRLQFNIHVEPIPGLELTSGITATHVPIMWVNEHVSIDSKDAHKLKKDVLNNLEIIKWVEIGMYILGGLLILISLLLLLCSKKDKSQKMKLVASGEHQNGDYGSMRKNSGCLNPSLINASK